MPVNQRQEGGNVQQSAVRASSRSALVNRAASELTGEESAGTRPVVAGQPAAVGIKALLKNPWLVTGRHDPEPVVGAVWAEGCSTMVREP